MSEAAVVNLPPRTGGCIACGSRNLVNFRRGQIKAYGDTEIVTCLACRTVWEPLPLIMQEPERAAPCGNCPFGRSAALSEEDRSVPFYCHKGLPIDQGRGPGHYIMPQNPNDARVCSGWLRAVRQTENAS